MTSLNDNLKKLDSRNTFLRVKEKTNIYKQNNPNTAILNLGIGDVSLPIIKPITDAMKNAVGDLSNIKTFKGYGNYFGYDFLKLKIIDNEYKNLHITSDEIYVSNGTKSDTSNVLELFDKDSKILVFNPSYPVHRDGAILSGYNVSYLDLEEENNFMPRIPNEIYDIIYICSPSNPIGIAFDKKTLTKWIDYARKNNSVILYDNVYNAFIRGENIPKSIYELDYAKEVAIEFRSFSKTISFTGVRCSYYVIPNILKIKGTKENVNELWKERTMNKYNGTDYIAQVGATASYSDESKKIIKNNIEYYLENAKILRSSLENLGFVVYGGTDSPYLWIRTMNNMDSWQYYDFLLKEFNIIAIPGVVFGSKGNNYMRLSALANRDTILSAIKKMGEYYEKKC